MLRLRLVKNYFKTHYTVIQVGCAKKKKDECFENSLLIIFNSFYKTYLERQTVKISSRQATAIHHNKRYTAKSRLHPGILQFSAFRNTTQM